MSSLDVLTRSPAESGLFFDFDGTLSEIVPRPEHARPLPGIPEVLDDLARVFRLVAVVSGRSAHQLVEWLGPRTEIWGLHGAQRAAEGRVELAPDFRRFEEPMANVRDEARARFERSDVAGLIVEDKQVMVTLHWRTAPDERAAEREVAAVAAELADLHGLKLAPGKLSVELRPPVEVSKKDVVARRAAEEALSAVAFAGDDVVDLPAFDALDRLEETGCRAVRVGVDSEEAPEELLARADVVVDGPEGVLRLLQELLSGSGGVAGSPPS